MTGPVGHSKTTGFLFSFNRAEEDLNAIVNATVPPSETNPSGNLNENVATPTRDTEFSIRLGHKFDDEIARRWSTKCDKRNPRKAAFVTSFPMGDDRSGIH